jgi:transposase-like protein
VYPYAFGGAKPYVYFDAIVVKVLQDGRVINKAIHLALGVNLAGRKELLGLWMTQNEYTAFTHCPINFDAFPKKPEASEY